MIHAALSAAVWEFVIAWPVFALESVVAVAVVALLSLLVADAMTADSLPMIAAESTHASQFWTDCEAEMLAVDSVGVTLDVVVKRLPLDVVAMAAELLFTASLTRTAAT